MRFLAFSLLLFVACRDLTLPPTAQSMPGTVFGRVVYGALGSSAPQPAVGAVITLSASSLSVTAGADGRFNLEGLTVSTGTLLFQFDSDGDGRFDRQRSLTLEEIGAQPGRQINLGDLTIGESAQLHGLVLRADLAGISGGHAGTQVFIPLTSFVTYSAADGRYQLNGIPAGHATLGFFRAGYLPAQLSDLTLQPAEDFSAAEVDLVKDDGTQTGTVKGTVFFTPAAASLSGVSLSATNVATGDVTTATSDGAGAFTFNALKAGLYDVRAVQPSYTPALVPNVLVFGAQTVLLDVALGQGPASDGGVRPPLPDAGPSVGCTTPADCGPGQWCDNNFCAPFCSATVGCSAGRICDAPTHTCVTPCASTCPTGQSCDPSSRTCRALCDVGLPCPGGFNCSANICVPQCAVDSDCPTTHLTCQGGACIPDGTCGTDLDCLSNQICAGVLCATRQTPDGGTVTDAGWPCKLACECRTGETCSAGTCVADLVPTVVLTDGGGLDVALATAHPGDVIALASDTVFYANDGFTLARSGVTLSGGFVACGTRSVFDAMRTTTLVSDGGTALRIAGTVSTPLNAVALRQLSVHGGAYPTTSAAYDALAVTFTSNVKLDHVQSGFVGALGTGTNLHNAIHLADSPDAGLTDVSILPSVITSPIQAVLLERSSGVVTRLVIPTFTGTAAFTGVRMDAQTGDVVFVQPDIAAAQSSAAVSFYATNCNTNTLELATAHIGFPVGVGVQLTGCSATNIHDSFIDGLGTAGGSGVAGIKAQGSGGFITKTRVTLPATALNSVALSLSGAALSGPWELDDDTVDGCGATGSGSVLALSSAGNVTVKAFNVGGFGAAPLGQSCNLIGVSAANSTTLTVDHSMFVMPGVLATTAGFDLSSVNVLIDHSFINAGIALNQDTSNIEVYSSFLYGHGNGAVKMTNGQLYAVGSDFDGQGSVANTYGVYCNGNLTTPVVVMKSCILNGGGGATTHAIFANGNNGDACFTPGNYDHNYFYFTGPGGRSSNENVATVSSSTNGLVDGNDNIVGENVPCYGVNLANPSYVLTPNSPCNDLGIVGNEKNGMPVSTDITDTVHNSTPDIGAYEH